MTMASYTRKFVTEHKAYQKDSVVNDEINWYRLPSLHSILCVRCVPLMRVSCAACGIGTHHSSCVCVCVLPGT